MVLGSPPTQFPLLNIHDKTRENEIRKHLSPLIVDDSRRDRIKATFIEEMTLGLSPNPDRPSSLQMENTYISELTNGTEEGEFLSLDLGGTNLRVIMITLERGKLVNEDVEYFDIPGDVFLGEGSKLFDLLANSIAEFMRKRRIERVHHNLGFTFSFPMIQKGLNIGILTSWTKSFNCPGVIGEDVVRLLNEAIKRTSDIDVTVTAVLNDTSGTIVQGSYLDKRCAIGMILGTGCNACYLEKVANIPKWQGHHEEEEEVVDIEWGSFGDNGVLDFMRTEWDDAVDSKSLLKKSFTFEKYIGGKFLGNIVQEVLTTLWKAKLIGVGSEDRASAELARHGALRTSDVTKIEQESIDGELTFTKAALSSLGLEGPKGVTDDDATTMQYVCGLVSYRAVILVSILCSILIDRMDRPHCTIAIDGSLYENHPRFKPLMEHLIAKFSPDKSFSLLLAKDGSGKGAGLVTAIEHRLRTQKKNH